MAAGPKKSYMYLSIFITMSLKVLILLLIMTLNQLDNFLFKVRTENVTFTLTFLFYSLQSAISLCITPTYTHFFLPDL